MKSKGRSSRGQGSAKQSLAALREGIRASLRPAPAAHLGQLEDDLTHLNAIAVVQKLAVWLGRNFGPSM